MRYTQEGLVIDRLGDIVSSLQEIAKEKFSDLLTSGQNLQLDESSLLGRVLAIIAEPEQSNQEVLQQLLSQLDLDTATGDSLDRLVKLGRVSRLQASPSFANLILRGAVGNTVPSGSVVSSKITNVSFSTNTDVEFDASVCNGVDITVPVVTVGNIYTLTYNLTNGANTYNPISVVAVTGDTKRTILQRIVNIVNQQTSRLSAEFVDIELAKVVFTDQNDSGVFDVVGLSVVNTYSLTTANCTTSSTIREMAGSISEISTPVLGWLSVTNPFPSTPYESSESDRSLKTRYKVSMGAKINSRDALISSLYSLNGVRYVNVKENIFDSSLSGITPHGMSVTVFGGDEDEIAEAIKANRPVGCMTVGDITKSVTDINGDVYQINFNRPELVEIEIELSLMIDPTFPQNGKTLIQNALLEYFESLNVGDDIMYSRLYTPINSVLGQSVVDMKIGVKGSVLGRNNIGIFHNQLAVISYSDIKV